MWQIKHVDVSRMQVLYRCSAFQNYKEETELQVDQCQAKHTAGLPFFYAACKCNQQKSKSDTNIQPGPDKYNITSAEYMHNYVRNCNIWKVSTCTTMWETVTYSIFNFALEVYWQTGQCETGMRFISRYNVWSPSMRCRLPCSLAPDWNQAASFAWSSQKSQVNFSTK
jgi:hypothetical protein